MLCSFLRNPDTSASHTSASTRLRQHVPTNASTPMRLSPNASPPTRPHQRVYANASTPTRLRQRVSSNASPPTRPRQRVCSNASPPVPTTRLLQRVNLLQHVSFCANASALARDNVKFLPKTWIPLATSEKSRKNVKRNHHFCKK